MCITDNDASFVFSGYDAHQDLRVLTHSFPTLRSSDLVVYDDSAVEIDFIDFARLQTAGDQDSLVRAVELYRGEFLAGIEVDSEAFNEWLQQTRAWYREQVEGILTSLLALQDHAGAQDSAIRPARRILAPDPLRPPIPRCPTRAFADPR